MKSICLIEDDDDGCELIFCGDDQEQIQQDALSFWESVMDLPNQGFAAPEAPGPIEFEEGEPYCVLKLSWPLKVATEIVEDWLADNASEFKREQKGIFSYR